MTITWVTNESQMESYDITQTHYLLLRNIVILHKSSIAEAYLMDLEEKIAMNINTLLNRRHNILHKYHLITLGYQETQSNQHLFCGKVNQMIYD